MQSNTLYNETCFDFSTTEASTVETECHERVREDCHARDDLEDDGQVEGEEEVDEEDEYESEVESTIEEQNLRLKNQLRLKELYIKQLEERLSALEMRQSTSSKHNLCGECRHSLLHKRYE